MTSTTTRQSHSAIRSACRFGCLANPSTHAGSYGAAPRGPLEDGQQADRERGRAYDVEFIPTPNGDNPLFEGRSEDYPKDLNNIAPPVGVSYTLDSEGKSAMHGGFGLFYQRTVLTVDADGGQRPLHGFVHRQLPAQQHRPSRRSGAPTDPMLVNGPTVNGRCSMRSIRRAP